MTIVTPPHVYFVQGWDRCRFMPRKVHVFIDQTYLKHIYVYQAVMKYLK